ncbi:MAG TPA: SMP-30/gluconolactonase/LRE family protein [Candidatus Tumulicola sp.]
MKKRAYPAVAAMVLPLLAACSSASSPTPAVQSVAPQGRMIASVRADVRFGLSGSKLDAALLHRGHGDASSAKTQATLFISDLDTQTIELYPANAKKPKQSGSITDGIDEPVNDAVDASGTLYVANNGNSTVTEYPLGSTSPSVTLSDELVYPNGVAVDNAGTVYVTSGAYVGQCYVLVFPKGATSPSAQINGFELPVGLATDKKGDLFVGDAVANAVWEVPKGTTTPKNLNLTELSDPVGVAIDPKGHLWVANYSSGLAVEFKIGDTKPLSSIDDDLAGPYSIAFGKNASLYVGNSGHYPGDVTAFKKNKTSPYATISSGNPAGVAVYPAPKNL